MKAKKYQDHVLHSTPILEISREYLSKHYPDVLKTKEEIHRLNGDIQRQHWDKSQRVWRPNPAWHSNAMGRDLQSVICQDISQLAMADSDFRLALGDIPCNDGEERIDSAEALRRVMLEDKPGKNKYSSRFSIVVSEILRNQTYVPQSVLAQENEDEGEGPFQCHKEDDVKKLKDRIIGLMSGSKGGVSEDKATAILVEMLEEHGMAYVWQRRESPPTRKNPSHD